MASSNANRPTKNSTCFVENPSIVPLLPVLPQPVCYRVSQWCMANRVVNSTTKNNTCFTVTPRTSPALSAFAPVVRCHETFAGSDAALVNFIQRAQRLVSITNACALFESAWMRESCNAEKIEHGWMLTI